MNRRQPRRLPWALIASLLLHALLLGLVVWKAPADRSSSASAKPLEIELVMVAPKVEPAPTRPVSPLPPAVAATSKKGLRRPSADPAAAPEAIATAPAAWPSAPVGKQADSPRRSDAFLVPRVGSVLPGLGSGEETEAAGHTLRNGPGEEPDAQAVREYTAERNQAKLDDQLGEMVAAVQRQTGLVDPYFTRLQADLSGGFKGAHVELSERTAAQTFKQEVVDTYTGPASQFGRTGNPMSDPEQARPFNESSFGRTLERGGNQLGDAHDQRMLEAGMQSMAFTQVIRASASRPRLKTVLMLRQDGDGALAETTVLEHSGDSEFDEFVIHLTRKVVRDQGDTSETGGGPSALGWSSVWQFTWEPPQVKVKLLRVVRPPKAASLKGAQ